MVRHSPLGTAMVVAVAMAAPVVAAVAMAMAAVAEATVITRMAKAQQEAVVAMGRRPPTEPQIHPSQEMKLLQRYARFSSRILVEMVEGLAWRWKIIGFLREGALIAICISLHHIHLVYGEVNDRQNGDSMESTSLRCLNLPSFVLATNAHAYADITFYLVVVHL